MKPDWLSRKIGNKLDPLRPGWLRLGDDDLPGWLHAALCLGVASPFYLYLGWLGLGALLHRHLDPVEGPEMGQRMFGSAPLDGSQAVRAGFSLLLFAAAFVAISVSFMRFEPSTAAGRLAKSWTPWILVALSSLLGWRLGRD